MWNGIGVVINNNQNILNAIPFVLSYIQSLCFTFTHFPRIYVYVYWIRTYAPAIYLRSKIAISFHTYSIFKWRIFFFCFLPPHIVHLFQFFPLHHLFLYSLCIWESHNCIWNRLDTYDSVCVINVLSRISSFFFSLFSFYRSPRNVLLLVFCSYICNFNFQLFQFAHIPWIKGLVKVLSILLSFQETNDCRPYRTKQKKKLVAF